MPTTANRIKEALQIRNLKQADLVEKTRISKGALSSYISGNYVPKQKNLYLIAKALDVSEAWLMGLDVPMERKSNPSSEQAFMEYLYSLGYRIYRDDPEHKPIMSSESISSCRLKYDTLSSLKLLIDSYAKATVDSELLSLKEEEIKQERLEKERILQHLQNKNTVLSLNKNVLSMPDEVISVEENISYLEPVAAHERTDIEVTDEMRKYDDDLMDNDELWNK